MRELVFVDNAKLVSDFMQQWNSEPCMVIPVWGDLNRHPVVNCISFLYIRFTDKTYIVGYNHVDCVFLHINLSESTQRKWVYDKKSFLHSNIEIKGLQDMQGWFFNQGAEFERLNYRSIGVIKNYIDNGLTDHVINFTPISKLCEYLETVFIDFNVKNTLDTWVDSTELSILCEVEKFGVVVDRNVFKNAFEYDLGNVVKNRIYTQYNPYTITGRPSNAHSNINFSALKKDGISRKAFVPADGKVFVNMDYDAFHLRIIGKFIKLDLPNTKLHEWFAEQYGVDYNESKQITFRMLYGGVEKKYKHIEFFDKVQVFIESLWKQSNKSGYLETAYRKIPISKIPDISKQKLFNYFIQMVETDLNIDTIKLLLREIEGTGVELNLYVYDSFLFSIPTNNIDFADRLRTIVERNGFPVNISAGYNYYEI